MCRRMWYVRFGAGRPWLYSGGSIYYSSCCLFGCSRVHLGRALGRVRRFGASLRGSRRRLIIMSGTLVIRARNGFGGAFT